MYKSLYNACLVLLFNLVFTSLVQAKPLSEYIKKLTPDDDIITDTINDEELALIAEREQDIKKFYDFIITDDLKKISPSGKTVFEQFLAEKIEFIKLSSIDYYSLYKQDPADSDSKYLGKTIMLLGTVENIDTSDDKKPVLHLDTDDRRLRDGTHATFKDPERDKSKIARLSSGDYIHLLCLGNGISGKFPVLKDCEFMDDYEVEYRKTLHEKLDAVMNGDLQASRFALVSLIFSYAFLVDEPKVMRDLIKGKTAPSLASQTLKHNILVLMWLFDVETPVPLVLSHKDKLQARLLKHEIWKYLIVKKIIDPKKGKLLVKDFDFDNTPIL